MAKTLHVLGIESSCDETGVALVALHGDDLPRLLAHALYSQIDMHQAYGGVVPELASRDHIRRVLPLTQQVLRESGRTLAEIDVVAFTRGPGLAGALLVGAGVACALGAALRKPVLGVHHLEGHLLSPFLSADPPEFPFVALLVSGGHTQLMRVDGVGRYTLLGETIDDAAGEAFDKVAQILGLEYPGGPQIEVIARNGDPKAVNFPRAFLKEERLDFSFSGLKTAVLYAAKGTPGARAQPLPLTNQRIADLAASFQAAVVDILIGKCDQALTKTGRKTLLVGGGVAANTLFRQRLGELATRRKIDLIIAEREHCTDNAAMGALGWELWERGITSPLDLDVKPGLVRKAGA